jgi:hypothetical protein
MTPPSTNGWEAWRSLMLDRMDQSAADHREIAADVGMIKVEIGKLKVKAGVWGAAAGLLPALAIFFYQLLKGQ